MIGPRDKDLKAIFDELYGEDKGDILSKRSDVRSRMEIASRFTRGNVKMQNGAFSLRDFDTKLSEEVNSLIFRLKKTEK